MKITIFSLFPFFSSILVIIVGLVPLLNNKHKELNKNFFIFCITVFIWLFSYGIAFSLTSPTLSLLWLKIGYTGVIYIAPTLCAFVLTILQKKYVKRVRFILLCVSTIFAIFLWFSRLLVGGVYNYFWGPYPKFAILLPVFILYFCSIYSTSVLLLILNAYKFKEDSVNFHRLRYIGFALGIGMIGSVDYIANFGIEFYPFGWILIDIYISLTAYTIIKYRLMDVRLVITRTSIFVAVYSVVLGIPFALAFGWQEKLISLFGENWWIVPLITLTILATAGPFIYLYIQRRTEDRLLQEQRQYQATLRQASMGMGQIKDLRRLLQLIVHILTRTVSVEHCKIFLIHEDSKQLILKASRGKSTGDEISVLALNSSLVNYLREVREPVVYEEVKQRRDDYSEYQFKEIEENIKNIDGALIVPSFIDQKLIAILVLGKKKSGKLYTQDDLAVFSILANQAALAIENAQFYERMKETHMQLVKAEKMATVGTMADGLSHQINNRLHAMGFIAGDALDTIKLKRGEKLTKKMEAFLDEMEHSFGRIEDNVKRGGEVVEGLLKYTRKGKEGFETINLNKLLDASIEMVQYKIKLSEINFIRSFDDNIPDIQGNFTQLQEVFFNIIDNAYDAMVQRKNELKEEGYKGCLEICAGQYDHKLEILIKDNGIGVKKEDLEKLFTPFFTTKLSSKKGTGLGLYVIQQIIEENHGGRVNFTSRHKEGSQTRILLPIVTKS